VLSTELTRRFGLRVPVVSAPMAGASGGALAAAVSAGGGLGMIAVGDRTTPDWLHREAAIPAEQGVPFGIGLLAWTGPDESGLLDAVLTLDPAPTLVSVSYGSPAGDERRHRGRLADAGLAVTTQVGTLADAQRALGDGFDLLVVRGAEGGGHGRNSVATLPLLQEVLDVLAPSVPVLAAGGVASARGLAAVLAAGAAGAWVGTAFLACPESLLPDPAKARLLSAGAADTVYTAAFDRGYGTGWPAEFAGRALRNSFTDSWTGRESELAVADDARADLAAARQAGDYDIASIYAGQSVGLVSRQRPAAEVVAELATAEDLLRRW
jgi:nitronate monooxygenase